MDIVCLDRNHWRTIALTGHRAVADALQFLAARSYNAILFSGPADLRLIGPSIPVAWNGAPIISYFHESQWTYPAESLDRIPHLVNHLETVELSDEAWFNSRFHRRTFAESAHAHPSDTVRDLANEVIPGNWHKTHVVYPPVDACSHEISRGQPFTVSWSARWEREKRPDLFLAVIRACLASGLDLSLNILGCARARWEEDPAMTDEVRAIVNKKSGFLERSAYERALAGSHAWLSTTEHEFFGISAIEAAMLGATPVVPDGLAYPETLPSAYLYPPGDVDAAARRIMAIASGNRGIQGPWSLDAQRFQSRLATRRFDQAVEAAIARKGC